MYSSPTLHTANRPHNYIIFAYYISGHLEFKMAHSRNAFQYLKYHHCVFNNFPKLPWSNKVKAAVQGEPQSNVNWNSILNFFPSLTYCQCVTFMVTAKASIRAALGDTVILVTKEKTNIISCCLFKMGPTSMLHTK